MSAALFDRQRGSAVLFLKAEVRAYDRHTVDGNVVHVNAFSTRAPAAHARPDVVSYRSGASSPNIMRGYIVSNAPFGVSMAELAPRGAAWDMMIGYARRGGKVFIDSGAFTAFTQNKPMDWPKLVARYRDLIHDAAGARLHIVMPDVVGDQTASLNLLAEHRGLVHDVIAAGHDALVPIQKGGLSPYAAWRAAASVLGTEDFTASVPSNAAAFSPADLADLMGGEHKPARVHLLGVAGNKVKLADLVRVVHSRSPGTVVTSDACRIRAQVGEGRPITIERGKSERWLAEAFSSLLDDPKARAMFLDQASKVLAPAVAAMAISAVENKLKDKPQAEMF